MSSRHRLADAVALSRWSADAVTVRRRSAATATARLGPAAALTVVLLALGGCVSPAPAPSTQRPAPPPVPAAADPTQSDARGAASDIERDGGAPAAGPRSGATTALLAASRDERDNGDLAGAAATIERALSIAPDDALLWIELGEIRLEQGDRAAAAEMGRKALTLTGSDSALEARAQRLLGR